MTSLPALFKPPTTQTQFDRLITPAASSTRQLKQIHAHLLRLHHLSPSSGYPHILARLISAAPTPYALYLFRRHSSLLPPSTAVFNSLIRSLSSSLPRLALSHLRLSLSLGLPLSRLSLPSALRSAASLPSPAPPPPSTPPPSSPASTSTPSSAPPLADSYLKLACPPLALHVFDETLYWHRAGNVLLWNVSIRACCEAADLERAVELFSSMPERFVSSWNCLIDGFVKRGDMGSAERLFGEMPERNVVSWTTVVTGFVKNGDTRRALVIFDRMVDVGVRPNSFTLTLALAACARIGTLEHAVRIHEYVCRNGFHTNVAIGTALVDMCSKCGKMRMRARCLMG